GGARIDGDPTAFLTGSHPLDDLRTWWGSSQSISGSSHQLSTYALGLQLAGISGSQLRQMAILKKVDSPVAQHPGVLLWADSGYVMVGGGAFTTTNQYLVTSSPIFGNAWYAGSKDHGIYAPGYVRAHL